MHNIVSTMNTQRRTFRGRAGPTDGRLPKHNARRRKQSDSQKFRYEGITDVSATIITDDPLCDDDDEEDSIAQKENRADVGGVEDESSAEPPVIVQLDQVGLVANSSNNEQHPVQSVVVDDDENDDGTVEKEDDKQMRDETRHLLKRIQNLRSSIQQSSRGLTSITTFQQNVLNVVTKCWNEYRQIVRHFPTIMDDADQLKTIALPMFELIQHSLQCGPLSGSNPGYFKRCGSEVAKVVAQYLSEMVEDEAAARDSGFTEKQSKAIETWTKDALKAADANKPPSKSHIKKQEQAAKEAAKTPKAKKKMK